MKILVWDLPADEARRIVAEVLEDIRESEDAGDTLLYFIEKYSYLDLGQQDYLDAQKQVEGAVYRILVDNFDCSNRLFVENLVYDDDGLSASFLGLSPVWLHRRALSYSPVLLYRVTKDDSKLLFKGVLSGIEKDEDCLATRLFATPEVVFRERAENDD